jgi:hypothetical protein
MTTFVAFVAVVVVLVIVAFATGWADDKAPPGNRGRAPVTAR